MCSDQTCRILRLNNFGTNHPPHISTIDMSACVCQSACDMNLCLNVATATQSHRLYPLPAFIELMQPHVCNITFHFWTQPQSQTRTPSAHISFILKLHLCKAFPMQLNIPCVTSATAACLYQLVYVYMDGDLCHFHSGKHSCLLASTNLTLQLPMFYALIRYTIVQEMMHACIVTR